jgi:hypothetical protein
MIRKTVIRNGKKYIVNTAGWNDDVGPGAPAGTLWMRSATDNNWYAVTLTGTSASAAISINQTPLTLATSDLGYQLVFDGYNGVVAQVYLSGSAGSVVTKIASWPISSDYKPYLMLKSIDGNFYHVNVSGSALVVDQNSKWWPSWPNSTPPYSLY